MDDLTLRLLRRKKLIEFQKKLTAKENLRKEKLDVKKELEKVFVGRAWEVFNAAKNQYPEVIEKIGELLAKLVRKKEVKGPITGEQLMWFFRRMGLNVKLETRIKIFESGELKSLSEKLRGR